MRAILLLLLLVTVFQGCGHEVKPVLKQVQPDIAARIDIQQKRIKDSIAAREIHLHEAQPLQANLDRIGERYNRLKAEGGLTEKEIESLARRLDENSQKIYEASQVHKKVHRW